MDKLLKFIAIPAILVTILNPGCAQVSKERKLIVGTWLSEEKSRQLDFKANGECFELYTGSKISNTYNYRVSDIMPDCIPKESIDPKEKVTFLEMINKKSGMKLCYEINGFTATTLSLRKLGSGGYILLYRKE